MPQLQVPTLPKEVARVRLYVFDFSMEPEVVAGETLVTPTIPAVTGLTISAPAVISADFDGVPANKGVAATISGGAAGSVYLVECRCTTVGGATLVRRMNLSWRGADAMTLAALSPVYTDRAQIQGRVSTVGTALRLDDNAGAITQVIEEATTEVNGYCLLLYAPPSSPRPTGCASGPPTSPCGSCARAGTTRRPKVVQQRYEKALEDLERVRLGVLVIPDAAHGRRRRPRCCRTSACGCGRSRTSSPSRARARGPDRVHRERGPGGHRPDAN
jgi:hypothetical protein